MISIKSLLETRKFFGNASRAGTLSLLLVNGPGDRLRFQFDWSSDGGSCVCSCSFFDS